MPLWSRKQIIAVPVAIAVTLIIASFTASAHGAHSTSSKYYPDLMQNWQVAGPLKTETNGPAENGKFAIGLIYPGFLGAFYRQIGNKDVIPAMWTKLLLPAGMKLLSDTSHKSRFSDYGYRNMFHRPIPKTNLRWVFTAGVPSWKVVNVAEGLLPRVAFWVSGQPGQCLSASTQGMYRHHKHWVRIPHAPVQTAQACLPETPPTTTTSG